MIKNLIFVVYLLISDFLLESLKLTKTSKSDPSFYNTVSLKNLNSLSIVKNIVPQHCFGLVSEKSNWVAPFLDAQELLFWSTWKANVCMFCKSPFENFWWRAE